MVRSEDAYHDGRGRETAMCSSETSVLIRTTRRHHVPEDSILQVPRMLRTVYMAHQIYLLLYSCHCSLVCHPSLWQCLCACIRHSCDLIDEATGGQCRGKDNRQTVEWIDQTKGHACLVLYTDNTIDGYPSQL
jgi:hypothetical protein